MTRSGSIVGVRFESMPCDAISRARARRRESKTHFESGMFRRGCARIEIDSKSIDGMESMRDALNSGGPSIELATVTTPAMRRMRSAESFSLPILSRCAACDARVGSRDFSGTYLKIEALAMFCRHPGENFGRA